MIKIRDIAYVRFAAPDLDAMERFAADFGLVRTARENGVLYHRGSDPSPYSHVTEEGDPRFIGVAFEAADADDLDAAARLDGASPVEKLDAPGGGRVVRSPTRTATASRWSTVASCCPPWKFPPRPDSIAEVSANASAPCTARRGAPRR